MPAHEKILQFTKQYCIPSLIDNKELIQFGKDKSSMDQVESSRELIPYICFFNGLGVLEQMRGAKGKLEPPKDLLDGYKKKRDFILSLQSHQKSTDQCAADLKAAFAPPVQSQAQQPRISQDPFGH